MKNYKPEAHCLSFATYAARKIFFEGKKNYVIPSKTARTWRKVKAFLCLPLLGGQPFWKLHFDGFFFGEAGANKVYSLQRRPAVSLPANSFFLGYFFFINRRFFRRSWAFLTRVHHSPQESVNRFGNDPRMTNAKVKAKIKSAKVCQQRNQNQNICRARLSKFVSVILKISRLKMVNALEGLFLGADLIEKRLFWPKTFVFLAPVDGNPEKLAKRQQFRNSPSISV